MVTLLQREETYEVRFKGTEYIVTIMTDTQSGTAHCDVFGPNGEELETELERKVVEYVEENVRVF